MATFNADMAIMIPYNQQLDLFWKQFDSQIQPLDEFLINNVTDLINDRKIILKIPDNKQETYEAILDIYHEDLSGNIDYEPVAMLDARLTQLNHILSEVNNNTTLNKIINAILAYYMGQTDSNQLAISEDYQNAIFKTANKILNVDIINHRYNARSREFVRIKH